MERPNTAPPPLSTNPTPPNNSSNNKLLANDKILSFIPKPTLIPPKSPFTSTIYPPPSPSKFKEIEDDFAQIAYYRHQEGLTPTQANLLYCAWTHPSMKHALRIPENLADVNSSVRECLGGHRLIAQSKALMAWIEQTQLLSNKALELYQWAQLQLQEIEMANKRGNEQEKNQEHDHRENQNDLIDKQPSIKIKNNDNLNNVHLQTKRLLTIQALTSKLHQQCQFQIRGVSRLRSNLETALKYSHVVIRFLLKREHKDALLVGVGETEDSLV